MQLLTILLGMLTINSQAATTTALIADKFEYSGGDTKFIGYMAKPKRLAHKKVGAVIIVHDWMGMGDFTKAKAEKLAEMGYIALAADVYGNGLRAKDTKEAGELAGKYKEDRKLLQAHIQYAYDALAKIPQVDVNKIVVMGYCFGGTTALELARAGAKLAGVVTFHGGLANPTPVNAKNIKAKALIMHGAVDPYVPAAEVQAFQKEMNDAGVDYQFVSYSGAVHAFTNPALTDTASGAAYNINADRRSWKLFQEFLKEVAPI